jgi:hypothetical protein
MRTRFKLGMAVGAMALALVGAKPASAVVVTNGSFETTPPDFSGWATTGNTVLEDSTFKAVPDGVLEALLSNGPQSNTGGPAGPVAASSLETFLGLSAGALGATNGSAIKQTITASAGDFITFKFDFVTNEPTPNPSFNDYGFVTVGTTVGRLADTTSSFVATSPDLSSFAAQETGYKQFTVQFLSGGTFTLGFGVVNVGDTNGQSGLLVDAITTGVGTGPGGPGIIIGGGGGGVPLPAGMYLMPLGLVVAGAYSIKLRRAAC